MEQLAARYTPEELRAIYEQMDWDKNGSVSFVEFKSYLAKLKKGEDFDHGEALAAFQSIDEDGSRQLTWEEFFNAMTQVAANQNTSSMNDDELTKVFNEIDDDGNGYITPREAKKAFRKLADKFNISRSQVDEWIKATDYDSDGKITLEEFKLGVAGTALIEDF
eukprot:10280.XXX_586375_584334_1 [CDS] Oithona nana genome sequencing.